MHIFERKINYYETDKMGIVHHSNYIRFFEEARCDLLDNCGLSYSVLESKEILSPVLEISCKYKQHVTYGDIIEVRSWFKEFTGVRFTISYEIYNKKNNTLCVIGESNHCFTDSNLKPLNLKKYNNDIYEKLVSLVKK